VNTVISDVHALLARNGHARGPPRVDNAVVHVESMRKRSDSGSVAKFFGGKVTHPRMQRPWPRPRPGTLVALASLLSIVCATAVEDGCSGNSRCQHLGAFLQWYRDREGATNFWGCFSTAPRMHARRPPASVVLSGHSAGCSPPQTNICTISLVCVCPLCRRPPGPHRRLSAPDSVTYLDNVEAFVSPAGGIGLRAARPISADSILMSVDNRWILDADAALTDPVMGPILADLEANGEACATDHCFRPSAFRPPWVCTPSA
jgi:hypothetical protein